MQNFNYTTALQQLDDYLQFKRLNKKIPKKITKDYKDCSVDVSFFRAPKSMQRRFSASIYTNKFVVKLGLEPKD